MRFSPLDAIDDIQRLSWTLRRKPLESFLAPQAALPCRAAAARWSAATARWSPCCASTAPAR